MTTCIENAAVILPDRILRNHSIVIDAGKISYVAATGSFSVPDGARVVDAEGRFVGPGFVDIHCHGGGSAWAHDDPVEAADFHLGHGTTRMLATTALLPEHADNVAAVRTIAEAATAGLTPTVAGIHMEGPYINPDFGAYRTYAYAPPDHDYLDFARAANGWLRAMTIAPELPGMATMVRDLQVATQGRMVFSVGHSRAARDQVEPLIPAGLRLMTHMFNATGAAVEPSRYAGTIEATLDTIVLNEPAIVAELVADWAGRHVRPELLQLALRTKGANGLVLVTDWTAADGCPAEGGIHSDEPLDVNFNDAGELAGSALTMDGAVGNMMRHTGASLVEAWRMASYNPARAHGWLADVGQIVPGRRADLIMAELNDCDLDIQQIWLGGELEER